MPRKPRMYLAGIPCHVIQRGNNRNACFFAENDYRMYLDYLQDACRRYHVAIHAYVLMIVTVNLIQNLVNLVNCHFNSYISKNCDLIHKGLDSLGPN
jgi:REP element-mobilizing transposase RayT